MAVSSSRLNEMSTNHGENRSVIDTILAGGTKSKGDEMIEEIKPKPVDAEPQKVCLCWNMPHRRINRNATSPTVREISWEFNRTNGSHRQSSLCGPPGCGCGFLSHQAPAAVSPTSHHRDMVCKPDSQTTLGIGCQGDFASQWSVLKRVCPGGNVRRVSIRFSHVSTEYSRVLCRFSDRCFPRSRLVSR